MRQACLLLASCLLLAACSQPMETAKSPPATAPKPTVPAKSCEIDRVVDGDTVHAACWNGAEGNLRLMGFDTPETYQSGCAREKSLGLKAKYTLQKMIAEASDIRITTHGQDKYQRLLARVYLDGTDVADTMVAKGLAVSYAGGKRINWCNRLGSA